MPDEKVDLDTLFCQNSKKFQIPRLLIKAICMAESSMDPNAYRFEPGFWDRYMKDKPEWAGRDPREVSASYGLMQVMYTTAAMFGFSGKGEELYDPALNVQLGTAVLRSRINEIERADLHIKHGIWSIAAGLARYNGGATDNPAEDGTLRNRAHVDRVMKFWYSLRKREGDTCI